MRKLLGLVNVAIAALALTASSAGAHQDSRFVCNQEAAFTGLNVGDVVVPDGGTCTLEDSVVRGNVSVGEHAWFAASGTAIGGRVRARDAVGVFFDLDSLIASGIDARETSQVFVYDSTVGGDVDVTGSSDVVQICGSTIDWDVEVTRSTGGILIGGADASCARNTIGDDVEVTRNNVANYLYVRSNTIVGDLEVIKNTSLPGSLAPKEVIGNVGGDELECSRNGDPFTASGNTGWDDQDGQCEAPGTTVTTLECNSATPTAGVNARRVIVPANGTCALNESVVQGDVYVGEDAYFEANGTAIGGDVRARGAFGVFINANSLVRGEVNARDTADVLAFNSTVGDDIDATGSARVQACGSVVADDILVSRGSGAILIGDDTQASSCSGNIVGDDVDVVKNEITDYLIVSGNTIVGDLEVNKNTNLAGFELPKEVNSNVGGDEIECFRNDEPFEAIGNTGWLDREGQCAEPAPVAPLSDGQEGQEGQGAGTEETPEEKAAPQEVAAEQ